MSGVIFMSTKISPCGVVTSATVSGIFFWKLTMWGSILMTCPSIPILNSPLSRARLTSSAGRFSSIVAIFDHHCLYTFPIAAGFGRMENSIPSNSC